jgi:SAM-dependent methyltransferase
VQAPAKLRSAARRVPLGELRVLEPACGPGLYLSHFGPGSVGLDASEQVCAEARAKGLDIRSCNLDQPGWSAAVDGEQPWQAVWLCDVLMHVAEPAKFLAELTTTLAPGAPVLCVEWCLPAPGPLHGLRRFLWRRMPGMSAILSEPTHLRTYHQAEIEALLNDAGLHVEATWLHSFEGKPLAKAAEFLARGFWPVRTILARKA